LEAGEQHDRRRLRGVGDLERRGAQDFDQLIVDGLDDLLTRGQALGEDFTA
jgi:hypothetical protein